MDADADGLINERELGESHIHEVLATDARTVGVYEQWRAGNIIIKFEQFARMFVDIKTEVPRTFTHSYTHSHTHTPSALSSIPTVLTPCLIAAARNDRGGVSRGGQNPDG